MHILIDLTCTGVYEFMEQFTAMPTTQRAKKPGGKSPISRFRNGSLSGPTDAAC
jgi:hypothetical protein